ncbi:ATP-dependent helicase [Arthrobacter sp. H14]|uniref:ATP-dependent helicase n=1 Tax=Arthrobacter sp. H14 TaxID=1312959 RepID=UPI000479B595|nr:ATP-dependent DNA helicase [Arthrobacter sp. H14]
MNDSAQHNLRLTPPAPLRLQAPVLSADQKAVVDLPSGYGPALILGAPGTGKSTVLVESAVKRIEYDGVDPASVLMLAPSRSLAADLRNQLTARLNRSLSAAPARTWASYAFDLIRRAKAEGRLPGITRAPKLLSGPEQDLIIAELLAGHASGQVGKLPWPKDLEAALGTRGFRQEVRQLFDRVIEYGITAADLARMGRELDRQDWVASARLFQEYRDLIDLRMPESFDPAGIITAARQLFQDDPESLEQERSRLGLVLVDDLQEANPAVHELLAILGAGKDVLAAACPDTVVQGFRGARPDLVVAVEDMLASGTATVSRHTLTTSHRLPAPLADAWQRVAGRISRRGGAALGRDLLQPTAADPVPDAAEGKANAAPAAEVHVVASPVHELRYIAQRILDAQLNGGRGLSEMAVIVRTGGQLAHLQRYLTSQGIPVRVPVAETAVRDEPAVRPLLDAYAIALDPERLTAEAAVALLTSRIGGASAIDLRRIRQSLRREELLGGGGRSSDALLVEALQEPAALATLGWEARPAQRVARMLAAGREAAAEKGANAETVLWVLWSATGLSSNWARHAVDGGPAGVRADRDLDAIMALFHTAERYVDQLPGSNPEQFLEYLLSQELPMDTLAKRAQNPDAVELMTPASAAGRQWPLVFVAGLQDGVWPNLRLRGELLGSALFVDAMELGPHQARQVDAVTRLREIRYDELRSFSAAISRASEKLVCTAVASEEDQPSQFIDIIDPWTNPDHPRPKTEVLRPLTLRALVAELRQWAQQDEESPEAAAEAVRQLARLVRSEVPVRGAHPDSWWGLLPLSSEGIDIVAPDHDVPVSPSKVEAVHQSPLNWFIQAAGGEAATDFARSLGTLVHQIAADMPDATGNEYVAELLVRWPRLGMKENWEGRLDYQRAETMVRKLAAYVIAMRSEGRKLLTTETDFAVTIPGPARTALLRGQVDRLEIDDEGRLVIVDLKTGKSTPTKADLERHGQLAAYQVAVRHGAFDESSATGGAVLAQLGKTAKNVSVQEQEPLDPENDWATPMIVTAAELMAGHEFESRHDPSAGGYRGHGCRVPEVCPLCPEGKQVTE